MLHLYLRRKYFFPNKYWQVKQIVLKLTHRAEVIFSDSVATRNRPLSFKLVVLAICVADLLVMIYCMVNLAK